MIVTSDSTEIFEFLHDIHRSPRDYKRDEVLAVEHEQNFHIVVYRADGDRKGFVMYSVADFRNNPSALNGLFLFLQEMRDEELPEALRVKALQEVESRLHARPSDSLFYDAH
ncbi:MAG: hypothetical protein FD123_353 [Bacteroidetes bacterium]|nr:MAG: hypothetical protein FD123_353 [Bacteroidota bacterium]